MNGFDYGHYKTFASWKGKRLTPAQLLIHDVNLKENNYPKTSSLTCDEVLPSSIATNDVLESVIHSGISPRIGAGPTQSERTHVQDLTSAYGWLACFRVPENQSNIQCRWMHVSSQFPEYIEGVFAGLSDWSHEPEQKVGQLRKLNSCIRSHERWSKHGRFFTPFVNPIQADDKEDRDQCHSLLLSVPFLDWTVHPGPTPPLRFQIDEREAYASSRSAAHPLRSLLQYKYRLEDTSDREKSQVYARHKPWNSDREVDLKVRRFYGRYPTGLNVDELWVLVVDQQHIVSFSSNQTWKARWPPLQLSSRIAEISFRGLQRGRFKDTEKTQYQALIHAIVCLNGAVGLVHRSFWTDLPLPLTERYAAQLGHLQYRLYRAPSTKLVLDLLQLQDELAIIEDISRGQIDIISRLEQCVRGTQGRQSGRILGEDRDEMVFALGEPNGVVNRLKGELQDLSELRTNTNELVTRTIQLVNIRLEDHGQAILVFTIVTVIFLPLSFLSSFFGMNVSDIRDMASSQWVFWASAATLTTIVVGGSTSLAFYGGRINEKFIIWKEAQNFDVWQRVCDRFRKPNDRQKSATNEGRQGIRVLDASHTETGRSWDLGFDAP